MKPVRILSGFTLFGVICFIANYNEAVWFHVTGIASTRDPIAAMFAGGLIGAGLALFSYRAAMAMLHAIAAYNVVLMADVFSLTCQACGKVRLNDAMAGGVTAALAFVGFLVATL